MAGPYRAFAALAIFLALVSPIACLAGPYEDGDAAFHRKDYAAAMELWRPLADGNDARAQAGLAAIYMSGLGVNQDYAEALFWAEKAANQGEAHAQYLVGSMYRDGKGVEKDFLRAADLFRKSADQNFAWAQYNLGLMYYLGEGIPHDRVEAYVWLSLAAAPRDGEEAQAAATASFMLEKVSAKLTPDQLKEAKQRVRDWKPAPAH